MGVVLLPRGVKIQIFFHCKHWYGLGMGMETLQNLTMRMGKYCKKDFYWFFAWIPQCLKIRMMNKRGNTYHECVSFVHHYRLCIKDIMLSHSTSDCHPEINHGVKRGISKCQKWRLRLLITILFGSCVRAKLTPKRWCPLPLSDQNSFYKCRSNVTVEIEAQSNSFRLGTYFCCPVSGLFSNSYSACALPFAACCKPKEGFFFKSPR